MLFRSLVFFILTLSSPNCFASDIESLFGASYTSFDAPNEEYSTYGISGRLKYNVGSGDSGFFVMSMMSGMNLLAWDYMFGYSFRDAADLGLEAGAFVAYSSVFSLGYGIVLGPRFDLSSKLYLSMPLIYRLPGFSGIYPMIGYRF